MLRTNLTAEAIDDVLAGTFPASDPPAWTPGMVRPAPAINRRAADGGTARDDTNDVRASDVMDVSRPTHSERMPAQGRVSLIGAATLALLLRPAILAVGTPVALGVRGVAAVAEWCVAIIRCRPGIRTRHASTPYNGRYGEVPITSRRHAASPQSAPR